MIYNIQFLRGFAALLVLMHHALPHFKAMNLSNEVFEFIAKFGNIGVHIFFVVSGYVMAKTTLGMNSNFSNSIMFIKKRFLRIFLGYWPIFLIAILYYSNFEVGHLEKKEILQSFFLVNSNMFDLVLFPAWSLSYELYFYLIIGLLLLSDRLKPALILPFIVVFIILKNVIVGFDTSQYINFFLSHLVIEFIAGYFLYYFKDLIAHKRWIIFSFVLFVSSYMIRTILDLKFGYFQLTLVAIFSHSIVWFFVLLENHDILTVKGIFKKIGDSSYTLYLIHVICLGFFYYSGLRVYLVKIDYAMFGFIVYILSIILISYLFYKLIELPLYKFAKLRFKIKAK